MFGYVIMVLIHNLRKVSIMNVFTNFNAKAKKNTAAVIARGAKAIAAIIIAKKRFFRSRGLACA